MPLDRGVDPFSTLKRRCGYVLKHHVDSYLNMIYKIIWAVRCAKNELLGTEVKARPRIAGQDKSRPQIFGARLKKVLSMYERETAHARVYETARVRACARYRGQKPRSPVACMAPEPCALHHRAVFVVGRWCAAACDRGVPSGHPNAKCAARTCGGSLKPSSDKEGKALTAHAGSRRILVPPPNSGPDGPRPHDHATS